MSLKSDKNNAQCRNCGHSQYVHAGGQRGKKDGPCNAYTCKRDKKCKQFKP